jgi:hypothetical protein
MKELVLPWPSKDLSPNARKHWAAKAKAAKAARYMAGVVTMAAGWQAWPIPDGRLHLWVDFYPPRNRIGMELQTRLALTTSGSLAIRLLKMRSARVARFASGSRVAHETRDREKHPQAN